MFSIDDNGVITITKGDSAKIEVVLETEGGRYNMRDGDFLTLTVRRRATKESEVLLSVTSTTEMIVLKKEQTATIPVGAQSYDIQLDTADGERCTVVGAKTIWDRLKNFVVLPEVTV